MSGCDQRKGGRGSRRRREGHLNNIPFIHRTKQTSTESLLQLEVGSMGKGRNRWGTGVSLKKIQPPPQTGVPGGGAWSVSTQEESRSKADWEGQNRQGWREEEGPGGRGGCLATGVKGLPSPCWDPPSPSGLAGRGQPATPVGRSGAARCSRQGAGGGSQRLALQGDDSAAPQLLCKGAAVLDLLVAVCL